MKKVIVIPARLDSSRLPKKVLLDLKGKTVIQKISEGKLGLVVIIDNNKIIGIITDGDIRRAMESREKDFFNLKAEDLISNEPKLIYESDKLISASNIMSQHKINSLLVVNESNDLVGVVQVYDLGV